MTKGRGTNNRHKRKRLPTDNDLVGRGTQSGSLRMQLAVDVPSRVSTKSWWNRTKDWWAEKFQDAEASVAPKRGLQRVERQLHERQQLVGEAKQVQQLGQVRRKT